MPGHRLVLAVIVSCQLLLGVDATIVNVALPKISVALDFSPAGLAWVLNAYTVAFAGLLMLGGRLGDVLGRRRMFVAGVLVFTGASLAGVLARSAGWLLAARALQGVGAALASPSTLALITSTFPEGPGRNRALAISSAVISGGASLGLILGGVVTAAVSWRWVFLVNVPIGLVIVALAVLRLQEPPRHAGRFDVAGALTVTAGMSGIVYGLIRAATAGWNDPWVLAALVGGVLALAGFVAVEARTAAPILPLRLLADRDRAAAYGAILLMGASLMGPFFFLTTFLQQTRGFGPVQTGLAFLPMTGGLFTAARFVPRLLGRLGAKPVIAGGITAVIVSGLLLARVDAQTSYLAGVCGPLLLIGLGGGFAFIPMYTLILSRVTGQEAGAASGVLQTTQWLGGAFGLAVLVAAAGTAGRMSHAFLTGAGLAAAALVLILLLVRSTQKRTRMADFVRAAGNVRTVPDTRTKSNNRVRLKG